MKKIKKFKKKNNFLNFGAKIDFLVKNFLKKKKKNENQNKTKKNLSRRKS